MMLLKSFYSQILNSLFILQMSPKQTDPLKFHNKISFNLLISKFFVTSSCYGYKSIINYNCVICNFHLYLKNTYR